MDTELFNKDMDEQATEQTPTTIKVGEKEYSQADLERFVGLGEIGAEAEDKYGVKIDKIWPNHQRTINEKMQLEQRIVEIEKSQVKAPTEQELSTQQIEQQAREQLSKLGYVAKDEVQRIVNDTMAGFQLRNEIQSTIDGMVEQGYPQTNLEDLLNFMADPANPKNPTKAYKLMFEDQIDKIKEQKLASLKPSQFTTISSSTAGSKAPAPQKVTNKNLKDAIMAALPD